MTDVAQRLLEGGGDFAEPSMAAGFAHCRAYDVPAGTPSAGALHDDVTAGTLPTLSRHGGPAA